MPAMICLHPISALPAWRLASTGAIPLPEPCEVRSLRDADASATALEDIPSILTKQEGKAHLLVSESSRRHNTDKSVCHVGPGYLLPEGSFASMGREVLIPSPELCFALLASTAPREVLLRIGMELCGHYRKTTGDAVFGLEPLTTPDGLKAFVEELPAFRGSARACQAARYVMGSSMSPIESQLALMCTLPSKMGGYQLPVPALNLPMELEGDAQIIAGQAHAAGDLYWRDAGLVVEYDSDFAHKFKHAKDVERRDGLERKGLRVISITTNQFRDFERLDACLRMVGSCVRGYSKKVSAATKEKRRELYEALRASSWLCC